MNAIGGANIYAKLVLDAVVGNYVRHGLSPVVYGSKFLSYRLYRKGRMSALAVIFVTRQCVFIT
jgi:hypothetical protein